MRELLPTGPPGYVRPLGRPQPVSKRGTVASIHKPKSRDPMPTFVVEGGRPLSGSIRPAGNKNAALPCLCAAVLSTEDVVLHNVPRIRDVETLLEILASLGAEAE